MNHAVSQWLKEDGMKKLLQKLLQRSVWLSLAISALLLLCPAAICAANNVMGALEFDGKTHVEQTSGVWVDGQYVGYLKELKGDKQVMLLPGEHVITVRQDGYRDFTTSVQIQPGRTQLIRVAMATAVTAPMPPVLSTVKIDVNPTRAAVFMDGLFVGHVGEFKGPGRGMLIAPGKHKIQVALPGYHTFETVIEARANQKVEIKTDLLDSHASPAGPLVVNEENSNAANGPESQPAVSEPAAPAMASPGQ
jgi:hypothetical protein